MAFALIGTTRGPVPLFELRCAIADPELDVEEYEEARNGRYRRREGFY